VGVIVSLTRFLHFGKLPENLRQKYLANVYIDCTFMAATRAGVPAREVLTQGIEAYRAKGYPDEWKLHHQGGSIGYTGRDYRTNFQTPDVIQENQGFTWNPSITGRNPRTPSWPPVTDLSPSPRPVLYPSMAMEAAGTSFARPVILELP